MAVFLSGGDSIGDVSDFIRPFAIAGSTVIGTAVGGPVGGAVAGSLVAKASSSSGAKMASTPLTDCLSRNLLGGAAARDACVKAYGSQGAAKGAPFDIMKALRTFEANTAQAIAQTAPRAPARPSTTPKLAAAGSGSAVGIYDNQRHPFYVSAMKNATGARLLLTKRFVIQPANIIPIFAKYPALASDPQVVSTLALGDNSNRAKYGLAPLSLDRAKAKPVQAASNSWIAVGALSAAAVGALFLWNKSQKKRGAKGFFK